MAEQTFYASFTDRHRGSRELVESRLEADYLPFLAVLKRLYPDGRALDLGCGRGEWLELLAEHGFEPYGIDLDDVMLAACRERGFTVEKQDAAGAFTTLADESQAIVSGFHIVEHIPFEELQKLVCEAKRVLKPGGLMILETPNPENILVSTSGFHLDPTHRRPIPLHLLAFLAEYHGFARTKVLRLHEAPETASKAAVNLLDVLGGVSPDYAIVAQKPGSEEQMASSAEPFTVVTGVMLEALALRYDRQSETRFAQAEMRIARAEERMAQSDEHSVQLDERIAGSDERAAQAEARIAQSEARIAQAEARIAQAEARIIQAEERAAKAETERQALYASRSWRLTQPLRSLATVVRRVRGDTRAAMATIRQRFRSQVLHVLSGVFRFVRGNPAIKRLALAAASRFPRLEARLRRAAASVRQAASQPAVSSAQTGASPEVSNLPPRIRRIHAELTAAVRCRVRRHNREQG